MMGVERSTRMNNYAENPERKIILGKPQHICKVASKWIFKNSEGEYGLNIPMYTSRDRFLSWSVVNTVMKLLYKYLRND